MKIETTIEINATAKKVWDILMDAAAYPTWNPFIKTIKGKLQVGEKLEVNLQNMTFKPIVQQKQDNAYFAWKGKLGIRGIFDGLHQFELIKLAEDKTKFIHSEEFSGLLVPFLKNKLQKETQPGFEAMNRALKQRAEA